MSWFNVQDSVLWTLENCSEAEASNSNYATCKKCCSSVVVFAPKGMIRKCFK